MAMPIQWTYHLWLWRKNLTYRGASTNHKGIDISASTGAPIVAAADGEVVIATYSYSAGNYIMIDHGGGVSTVYMHCSQLLASKGQKVKRDRRLQEWDLLGILPVPICILVSVPVGAM